MGEGMIVTASCLMFAVRSGPHWWNDVTEDWSSDPFNMTLMRRERAQSACDLANEEEIMETAVVVPVSVTLGWES